MVKTRNQDRKTYNLRSVSNHSIKRQSFTCRSYKRKALTGQRSKKRRMFLHRLNKQATAKHRKINVTLFNQAMAFVHHVLLSSPLYTFNTVQEHAKKSLLFIKTKFNFWHSGSNPKPSQGICTEPISAHEHVFKKWPDIVFLHPHQLVALWRFYLPSKRIKNLKKRSILMSALTWSRDCQMPPKYKPQNELVQCPLEESRSYSMSSE